MAEPVDNIDESRQGQLPPQTEAAAPATPATKSFFTSGLLKGLAVTAVVFIGVMALIAGTMGTGSIGDFFVNGSLVTSFGEGFGHGIAKAAQFLATSWIGLGSLAVGGAIGVYREYKNANEQAAVAPDSQEHTKILELAQELEVQKSMNQQLINTQEKLLEQTAKSVTPKPETTAEVGTPKQDEKSPKKDDIYLPGSVIEDRDFRAGELKRRAEHTPNTDARCV